MQTLKIDRSRYTLSPTRDAGAFAEKLRKCTGKTKLSPIKSERRVYPKFSAGDSTAEYVHRYWVANGFSDDHRKFFAPLNTQPATLYTGEDTHELFNDAETCAPLECAPVLAIEPAAPCEAAAPVSTAPVDSPEPVTTAPDAPMDPAAVDRMAAALLARFGVSDPAACAHLASFPAEFERITSGSTEPAAIVPAADPAPVCEPVESPALQATRAHQWMTHAARRVYWVHCETARFSRELGPLPFGSMFRRPRSPGFMPDFLAPEIRAHRAAVAAAVRADRAAKRAPADATRADPAPVDTGAADPAPGAWARPGTGMLSVAEARAWPSAEPVESAPTPGYAFPADALPATHSDAAEPAPADRMAAAKFARQSAILEKLIRCDGQVMTRRAFLHSKIRDGLRLTVEQHDRIAPMSRMRFFRAGNEQQREHEAKIKAAGKKDVFFIGGFEITKTEFDYAAEILASMAPAADPAPVPGDSDPVPVNSADVDAVEVARLVAKFRQFADERRRTGDTLAAAIRVESAEARYRADSLTAPNAFRDAPGAGHEAAKAHDTRRAAEYRAAAVRLDAIAAETEAAAVTGFPVERPDRVSTTAAVDMRGPVYRAHVKTAAKARELEGLPSFKPGAYTVNADPAGGPFETFRLLRQYRAPVGNELRRRTAAAMRADRNAARVCAAPDAAPVATHSAPIAEPVRYCIHRLRRVHDEINATRATTTTARGRRWVRIMNALRSLMSEHPERRAPVPADTLPADTALTSVDVFADGFGFYWYSLRDGSKWTGRPSFEAAAAELAGMGMQARAAGLNPPVPADTAPNDDTTPAPLDGLDVIETADADTLAEFDRLSRAPGVAPPATDARPIPSGPVLRIPAGDLRARIPARFAPAYLLTA